MELQENSNDPRTPKGAYEYWKGFKTESESITSVINELKSSLETALAHQVITLDELEEMEAALNDSPTLRSLERYNSSLPSLIKTYISKANKLILGGVKQQEIYILRKSILSLISQVDTLEETIQNKNITIDNLKAKVNFYTNVQKPESKPKLEPEEVYEEPEPESEVYEEPEKEKFEPTFHRPPEPPEREIVDIADTYNKVVISLAKTIASGKDAHSALHGLKGKFGKKFIDDYGDRAMLEAEREAKNETD